MIDVDQISFYIVRFLNFQPVTKRSSFSVYLHVNMRVFFCIICQICSLTIFIHSSSILFLTVNTPPPPTLSSESVLCPRCLITVAEDCSECHTEIMSDSKPHAVESGRRLCGKVSHLVQIIASCILQENVQY